jgi:hypothetical protein
MKFLKNVLVVILSGCLFFVFLPTNVKAEDNNGVNQLSEPSSQFKDFCDEYYIKPDMFEVVDKENKDISNQFFESTIVFYQARDYMSIWKYAWDIVSLFKHTEEQKSGFLRGSFVNKNVKEYYYKLEKNGRRCPNFEFQYSLTATYTYNYNTGIITGKSGPYLSLTYCSLTGVWGCQMENVSTSATIAPNKYSIIFRGSFRLMVASTAPIGNVGVPFTSEVLGPYSGGKTCYPE